VKIRRKKLTRERIGWWLSIVLSKLFGREVRLENSDKKIKIFPFIWGGKIHLFGAQFQLLQARFEWPYTLSLRAPEETVRLGEASAPSLGEGSVCAILCHLPQQKTDLIMEFFKAMTPDATIVLAYGGRPDEFEKIQYPHKFYIEDERIRGLGYRQSYFGLMDDLSVWMDVRGILPRWITILDYDCLPLDPYWNSSLVAVMERERAGFGGKLIRNCTNDNSLFVCNAVKDRILQRLEIMYPELELYQCLGALLCFNAECLEAIRSLRVDFEDIFFEVALPTSARLKGFRTISFDALSDMTREVRFRPQHALVGISESMRAGVRILHPVKEIEQAISLVQETNLLP